MDVPPIPGTFVVNSGRALEFVTNGVIRATSHRVLSPKAFQDLSEARYSVPFFQSIDMNATLAEPKYRLECELPNARVNLTPLIHQAVPDEIERLKEQRGILVETDGMYCVLTGSQPC